ncbi:MAG: chemotaxis protein CheA [Boseongicola sp.]|nr:MAG: chemotaxis protein CheA [Boseongicola sp.]
MSDPMQEIRNSFFIESEELLESLFDVLQEMSDGDTDNETINVAFRAVHSIKGGAGAFALEDLVGFAHHFETVMDMVRDGTLTPDGKLIALFFRCGDTLSDLVCASRDGAAIDAESYKPVMQELMEYSGADDSNKDEPEPDFQPMSLDLGDLEGEITGDDDFFADGLPDIALDLPDTSTKDEPSAEEISGSQSTTESKDNQRALCIKFAPEPELYESANEPLYLIRNLADLGPCTTEVTFTPSKEFNQTEPTAGLLWTITLVTDADECAVREIFEFVDGLCRLEITEISLSRENAGSNAQTEFTQPDRDILMTAPDLSDSNEDPTAAAQVSVVESSPPSEKPKDFAPSDQTVPPKPAAFNPLNEPANAPAKKAATPSATVRVDLNRIERLVNLVGELVINQAMLSQSVAEAGLPPNSTVSSGLDEFQQLTRDIQESVMMIRAQPVKSLFQRMSRIVREASAAVDKKVRLVPEGETTEIDKTVIERLADPLTHMIRNAVDHGLESTEERRAAGKPDEGCIRLSAAHRSGRVAIEISDDGGGINRPKVRQLAIEKGLIHEDAQLSDTEIDHLLFLPGFSTATEISNLSGRGVGMDVVKNAITSLGGRIAITSTKGKGTTFSISLPLTLAVLDGMVIGVEGETLVVPLSAIAETLTIQTDDIKRLGPETSVLAVRNEFVPLLDLGVELNYRRPRESYDGAIALLISQEDGTRSALVIDAIDDQRQVVIKGLQDSYGHVPGIAAATILGNGQIALILDSADLITNARGQSRISPIMKEAS